MNKVNIEKRQIDLIKESICVFTKCEECKELFKNGELSFSNIEDLVDDRGRSCLFRLKEMCHDLFRNSSEASYKEKLYDITVGYIFHEAMKLRESLYQIEYYGPKHDLDSQELTDLEKKIVHEMGSLINKAEKRIKEGLKEIKVLSKELAQQLKGLMKLYKGNYLVPRFVFENEKTLVRIFGKKGFDGLLNDMYRDGRMLLMFKAAQSYLESEYFGLARDLFQRVGRVDRSNTLALFLYLYTSAFHFFFKNRFLRAKKYAEEALVMTGVPDSEVYRKALIGLIAELSVEARGVSKRREDR